MARKKVKVALAMAASFMVLVTIWLSSTTASARECTREDCLKVPWPKECDEYCAEKALGKGDYEVLTRVFKLEPYLAREIIRYRDDPTISGKTVLDRLQKKLGRGEMRKIGEAIRSLTPSDQREIINRGLIAR